MGRTPKKESSEAVLPAVENGSEEVTNGDSTDAPAIEAVKRKVDEAAAKADEAVATPEKKAKLDEASTKDEVQNGAEASEVAA